MEERPISEEFYNSETNAPFTDCLVCQKRLIDGEDDYFIERIFRRVPDLDIVEPLFEYAMCASCAASFRSNLSAESMTNMEAYYRRKFAENPPRPQSEEESLRRCIFTGQPIADSMEFSYHAHCRGDKMIASIFPYAVSDAAMNEVMDLLSNQTIDELDDFKGTYFTGPPELADLINPRRFVPI